MNGKTCDLDKKKVLIRLSIARDLINTLISEKDIEKNWLTIHNVLSLAQNQIAVATTIVARRHLKYCLLKNHFHFIMNTTQEIIKTFNYLE